MFRLPLVAQDDRGGTQDDKRGNQDDKRGTQNDRGEAQDDRGGRLRRTEEGGAQEEIIGQKFSPGA